MNPPCFVDGDLTSCSLSFFRDFVAGDGGRIGGDGGNDTDTSEDGSLDSRAARY